MEDFENMEWEAPAFDYSAEMKKIRKSLRKRNALIVLTSLILVAALAFGMIRYGIPALEKQYWDPNTSSYVEDMTDLELTMRAYTELFCPGYEAEVVESTRTGFATYSLTTTFTSWSDAHQKTATDDKSAVLCKGELTFPAGFWDACINSEINKVDEKWIIEFNQYSLPNLKKYPDYVHVSAVIHFPEFLELEEIMDFCNSTTSLSKNNLSQCRVAWVNVCNGTDDDDLYPNCGFDPNHFDHPEWTIDSDYPYLDKYATHTDTIALHFKSMLQFLQDQLDNGTGFLPPDCRNENYYTDVLNYVEENGIKSNSACVIAAPDALLDLYESGIIDGIMIFDAWISH